MVSSRVSRVIVGGMLACSLMLAGCDSAQSAFDRLREGFSTVTAEDYLSEVSSSLVPNVPADALKTEGTLTVGLRDTQAAPLVMLEAGSASGLDVSLSCSVADDLGLHVSFVKVSDVKAALESSCDVVMGVMPTEANGYNVVGDYAEVATALFQHGSDSPLVTADKVHGATVSVQEGSSAQMTLSRLVPDAKQVTCPSLSEAFDKLASGEATYVACSLPSGLYMDVIKGGVSLAGTLDTPAGMGIAVSSGNAELHKALSESYGRVSTNGLLAQAKVAWLGESSTYGPDVQIQGLTAGAPAPAPVETPAPVEEVVAGGNAVTV